MYLPEAVDRWHSYPPPRYSGGTWSYSHPWLWYDGNPHGGSSYSTWPTKITSRLAIPAPVTIRMSGNYNALTRTGTAYTQFRNDSNATINANVLFIVTEDSIQLSTPNGDQWHNHVARDFIPCPVGTPVTIPVGDSITFSQAYTIDTLWNVSHCEIVALIQDTVLASDSTKPILQGAYKKVVSLGIEEKQEANLQTTIPIVNISPNPSSGSTRFQFNLTSGIPYQIHIFNIAGQTVKTINGIADGKKQSVLCDLSSLVNSGIYFYRLESNNTTAYGKLIIKL